MECEQQQAQSSGALTPPFGLESQNDFMLKENSNQIFLS